MKRPVKISAPLSDSLHRKLNAYALSACAAGVGALALAQPAQAKIVYTPADVNFSRYPPVTIDLNHDGIGDFVLALGGRADSMDVWSYAFAYAPRSNNMNEVIATSKKGYAPAVALRAGSEIGPGRLFGDADILVEHLSHFSKHSGYSKWFDQWGNGGKGLKNRYLGLKFFINGKVHFGWARVTVTTSGKSFTATLTGYAYETIPNKSIIAGKTHGGNQATLGHLATGASAIPAGRVKPTAATTH